MGGHRFKASEPELEQRSGSWYASCRRNSGDSDHCEQRCLFVGEGSGFKTRDARDIQCQDLTSGNGS